MDLEKLGNYYVWADQKIIQLLEKVSEKEFVQKPSENLRSMRELAEHIISSYEFYTVPYNNKKWKEIMDQLQSMTLTELFSHWKKIITEFNSELGKKDSNSLFKLSTGENKTKDIQEWMNVLLYTDHSTYHRGQLIVTYKLVTGNKDAVATDYYEFLVQV